VDTNVLISALLFPHTKVAQTLLYVAEHHDIVLCDINIYELREVIKRKRPDKLPDMELFLSELSFELIPESCHIEKKIRDEKDQPILNAAIVADVDIILTGDKDFLCLGMKRPKCMSVTDFYEYEGLLL
jgi:putative PIN family toxin of toxin-antitoxin system